MKNSDENFKPTNEELQRLNKPEPRIQTGLELRDIATSCIDISDGLFIDLSHILNCSKVGADVQLSDIPYSKTLQKLNKDYDFVKSGDLDSLNVILLIFLK